MTLVLAPLLVAVVGALLYALTDGKLSEIGRILLFTGLIWLVYGMSGRAIHFG